MRPSPVLGMVYGQPLSLKSTLSADLSRACGWGLLSTGFFGYVKEQSGTIGFESARRSRYKALARHCAYYIRDGWSVVVDGNFDEPEWRKPILSLPAGGAARLALIRCVCSDQQVLQSRQESRATSRWCLDRLSLPYRGDVDVSRISTEKIPEEEFAPETKRASWLIDTGAWHIRSSIPNSDVSIWKPLDLLLCEWVMKRGRVSLRGSDA